MLDVKKFKDTETKKFFVSNTLKLKRTTTTCVIIEDSLGQEWEVYKDELLNFVMKNKIQIIDNVLNEYLVIDRYGNFCKAEEYDNWLIGVNSIVTFDKNDLKIGQSYILSKGIKVVYLGLFYQGRYSFSNQLENPFSYTNIYKKHIFIKFDRLTVNSYYTDSFVYDVVKNIIFVGEEVISKDEVDNIVNIAKEIDYYFYFSKEKADENRRRIKLKEVTAEDILNIKRVAYCNFKDIFKMMENYPNVMSFNQYTDFMNKHSIESINTVLSNLKVGNILSRDSLRKLSLNDITPLERTFTDKSYVVDLD